MRLVLRCPAPNWQRAGMRIPTVSTSTGGSRWANPQAWYEMVSLSQMTPRLMSLTLECSFQRVVGRSLGLVLTSGVPVTGESLTIGTWPWTQAPGFLSTKALSVSTG